MIPAITYFTITPLLNAVTSLGLAAYISFSDTKNRVAKYLVLFCLSVAAWSLGYFFWQLSQNSTDALFWSRGLMYGAVFTGAFFLHTVLSFLEIDRKIYSIFLLFLAYLGGVFFFAANTTNLLVSGVAPKLNFPFWPTPGPLYVWFIAYWTFLGVLASFLLFKKYRNSTGQAKKQVGLILVGISLALLGGASNFLLWYDIPVKPWGNGIVPVYVIMICYAIMNYNFLKLRVITAELFTIAMVSVFLIQSATAQNLTDLTLRLFGMLVVTIFGILLVRSVRREVSRREELDGLSKSLKRAYEKIKAKNVVLLEETNKKLQQSNKQLEKSNKNIKTANQRLKELDEQKEEFLMIAAHQLRTPLSAISGYIDLVKTGAYGKASKKLTKALDDIELNNQRLIRLADELLDINSIEKDGKNFKFEKIDLSQVVKEVVSQRNKQAEEKNLK